MSGAAPSRRVFGFGAEPRSRELRSSPARSRAPARRGAPRCSGPESPTRRDATLGRTSPRARRQDLAPGTSKAIDSTAGVRAARPPVAGVPQLNGHEPARHAGGRPRGRLSSDATSARSPTATGQGLQQFRSTPGRRSRRLGRNAGTSPTPARLDRDRHRISGSRASRKRQPNRMPAQVPRASVEIVRMTRRDSSQLRRSAVVRVVRTRTFERRERVRIGEPHTPGVRLHQMRRSNATAPR